MARVDVPADTRDPMETIFGWSPLPYDIDKAEIGMSVVNRTKKYYAKRTRTIR